VFAGRFWLGLVLTALAVPASAQPVETSTDSVDVVVLPFANHSGRYEALGNVLPVFYSKVDSLGLPVLTHELLRPILRKHRIRVVGQIGAAAMGIIRQETGARLAIVGSIDIYEPERAFEVMISARLVDLEERRVLTAISVGRTVQETERIFGRGRAEEIDEIVTEVVAEFMARMIPVIRDAGPREARGHKCGLVAVVPLTDYSKRRHGAEVLQNLLMSELVARDWDVVEPGIVREVLLEQQQMARGGVSEEVMQTLRDKIGVCLVVTGEVEEFAVAPSDMDASVPRINYGLRLVDVQNARLLASIDRTRDGMEGETFFARGREYSMARVVRSSMNEVAEWIAEKGDQ
jgi:TolB-like protein